MSHFSCLVIGPDPEKQMQPYHEFECTGIDDEYVQDIDITDRLKQDYENDSCSMARKDGQLVSRYDDKIFKKPGKLGFSVGTDASHYKPEELGWESVDVPVKEVYPNFFDYVTDYCGYDLNGKYNRRDGDRIIERTNPNKKWDWYVMGGRWANQLLRKDGDYCDQCTKGEADFEGMRKAEAQRRGEEYMKFMEAVGDIPAPDTWATIRERHPDNIDEARKEWGAHPWVKALRELDDYPFLGNLHEYYNIEPGEVPTQEHAVRFMQRWSFSATVPYAMVMEGKWGSKGEMGWFGVTTEEHMTKEEWDEQVNKILDALPDDTLLTWYDCHI